MHAPEETQIGGLTGDTDLCNNRPMSNTSAQRTPKSESTVRTATVDPKNVGWGSDPLKTVNAYLPNSYTAEMVDGMIVITGTDDAGWTLDGYVLPRLASGMIFATEVETETVEEDLVLTVTGGNGDYNVEDQHGRVLAIVQYKSYNRFNYRWSAQFTDTAIDITGGYGFSTLKKAVAWIAKNLNASEVN